MYAVIHVSEMERSETFYTSILDRSPDDRPMDGLIQWRETGGINLQLVLDESKAGASALTLVTPSIEDARRGLEMASIEVEPSVEGDFGLIAQVRDPDGNLLTLAEPPEKPYPSP